MEAKSQSGIDFSYLMSGYDLMESAGKHWMEAVKRFLPDTDEENVKERIPGMDIVRSWHQWYLDQFNSRRLRTSDMQVFSKTFLEQQKRCSGLALAWWKCSIRAMRAIGGGMQKSENPAQIMKECMDLSEEYMRCCSDLLAPRSEDLIKPSAAESAVTAGGAKKAKPVRTRAA